MKTEMISPRGQLITRAKSLVKCGRMKYGHYKTMLTLLTTKDAERLYKNNSVLDVCLALGMHDVTIKP